MNIWEFMGAHPWLTFSIILVIASAVEGIGVAWANAFHRRIKIITKTEVQNVKSDGEKSNKG